MYIDANIPIIHEIDLKHFKQRMHWDESMLLQHIEATLKSIRNEADIRKVLTDESVLRLCYNSYCEYVRGQAISNPRLFKTILNILFCISISLSSTTTRINTDAIKICDILKNKLKLTNEKQYEMLLKYYDANKGHLTADLLDKFTNLTSAQLKSFNNQLNTLITKTSVLDIGKALEIYTKGFSAKNIEDVSICTHIIYTLFEHNIMPTYISVIFNPSIMFIEKIINSKKWNISKTYIVISSEARRKIYSIYLNDEYLTGRQDISEHISIIAPEAVTEALKHDKCNVLIFDTYKAKAPSIAPIINTISENIHRIFAVCPDLNIVNHNTDVGTLINNEEIWHTELIYLLPEDIKHTRPNLFSFLEISHSNQKKEEMAIIMTSKYIEEGQAKIALQQTRKTTVSLPHIQKIGSKALRSSLLPNGIYNKAPGTRQKATIYQWSPEIRIAYTVSNIKKQDNKKRIKVYLKSPNNKKISTTLKVYEKEISAISNILQDYLFSHVNDKSIRKEAIEHILPDYDNKPLTIRALYYLYPDISKNMSTDSYTSLRSIILSEFGAIMTDRLTADDVYTFLEHTQFTEIKKIKAFISISSLLNEAVKHGHSMSNPLKAEIDDMRKADKMYYHIRSILSKKTFTQEEYIKFYEIVTKESTKKPEYISVAIRFLTGLETNAIGALTWDNFQYCKDYDFYYLSIESQMTNDGQLRKGFVKNEGYRIVPCPSVLADMLNKQYEKLLKQGLAPNILKRQSLFTTSSDSMAPYLIATLTKDLIEQIGISEIYIDIPDYNGGTRETDLSSYGADFMRENFKHFAKILGGLQDAELAHILGYAAKETYSRHYVDFLNSPEVLACIQAKIDRMVSRALSKDTFWRQEMNINNTTYSLHTPSFNSSCFVEINSHKQLNLFIESKYGIDIILGDKE